MVPAHRTWWSLISITFARPCLRELKRLTHHSGTPASGGSQHAADSDCCAHGRGTRPGATDRSLRNQSSLDEQCRRSCAAGFSSATQRLTAAPASGRRRGDAEGHARAATVTVPGAPGLNQGLEAGDLLGHVDAGRAQQLVERRVGFAEPAQGGDAPVTPGRSAVARQDVSGRATLGRGPRGSPCRRPARPSPSPACSHGFERDVARRPTRSGRGPGANPHEARGSFMPGLRARRAQPSQHEDGDGSSIARAVSWETNGARWGDGASTNWRPLLARSRRSLATRARPSATTLPLRADLEPTQSHVHDAIPGATIAESPAAHGSSRVAVTAEFDTTGPQGVPPPLLRARRDDGGGLTPRGSVRTPPDRSRRRRPEARRSCHHRRRPGSTRAGGALGSPA
jgi:hypothetical protein